MMYRSTFYTMGVIRIIVVKLACMERLLCNTTVSRNVSHSGCQKFCRSEQFWLGVVCFPYYRVRVHHWGGEFFNSSELFWLIILSELRWTLRVAFFIFWDQHFIFLIFDSICWFYMYMYNIISGLTKYF